MEINHNQMSSRWGTGYHGSDDDLPTGTHLTPEGADTHGRVAVPYTQPGVGDNRYVFYTDSPGLAASYGKNVYTVESMAPPSGRGKDKRRAHSGEPGFPRSYEYLSTKGFRVTGRLSPEEAETAKTAHWDRYWKSRGGQEAISRIVSHSGVEGLPPEAARHYRGEN